MACIMGPITYPTTDYVQAVVQYEAQGSSRTAFVLEKDGTCRVDLQALMAFASVPFSPGDRDVIGVMLARSVLAAIGHPVPMQPGEEPPKLKPTP